MKSVLIIASSILTIAAVIPYIVEIIRGKVKPRVVSWFTWSLLTSIALAASIADRQYTTAILLGFATLATIAVVVLGLRHGDRKFEKLDIICQIAALAGLMLWLIFNSPTIATVAVVAIDLVGVIPTLVHSWKKPFEEAWITFFLAAAGATATLFALDNWTVTSFLYPVYIVAANLALAVVIIIRLKVARPGEPSELREL